MTLFRLITFLLNLPIVYLKSRNIDLLSFEQRFAILKKLCLSIIKQWRIKLKVKVSEKIDINEPYYLVSNHQGTFDPIFLIASSPVAHSFISKEENLKIPIIGTWGKKIEFITFNRTDFEDNVQMLRQSMRFLKERKSLLVFPEGTRSRSDQMLEFKPGALLPAYGAKVKIIPVTLTHSYKMDRFKEKVSEICVTYHDPIDYVDYKPLNYQECSDLIKNIISSNQ